LRILTADIGNTHITLGAFVEGILLHEWRIASRPFRTADEYLSILDRLFSHYSFYPDRMIQGSVVPTLESEWEQVGRNLGVDVRMVRPLHPDLMPLSIDNPHEVGIDRVVDSWAALQRFPPPLLVIDFGTAITFDLVGKAGDYCGGIILPGINMGAEALHRGTALLPQVSVRKPANVVGRNTIDCILSGLYFGWLEMTRGLISRIEREVGTDLPIILTGGLATLFGEDCRFADAIVPTLTLEGLHLIDQQWEQWIS
jgi:type III pantothenate kinase